MKNVWAVSKLMLESDAKVDPERNEKLRVHQRADCRMDVRFMDIGNLERIQRFLILPTLTV